MSTCWICGSPADSAEHKIKRTDLVRIHGQATKFTRKGLDYLRSDGQVFPLQGPNSKAVKYQPSLCADCNNRKTQKADFAYTMFMDFIEDHADEIIRTRCISLRSVFRNPSPHKESKALFGYFAKVLGCRIQDCGLPVPKEIVAAVSDGKVSNLISVCFSIDTDRDWSRPDLDQKLGTGNILHTLGSPGITRYACAYHYRWLAISFWFNWPPFDSLGSAWRGEKLDLVLGTYMEAKNASIITRDDGSKVEWPGFET